MLYSVASYFSNFIILQEVSQFETRMLAQKPTILLCFIKVYFYFFRKLKRRFQEILAISRQQTCFSTVISTDVGVAPGPPPESSRLWPLNRKLALRSLTSGNKVEKEYGLSNTMNSFEVFLRNSKAKAVGTRLI